MEKLNLDTEFCTDLGKELVKNHIVNPFAYFILEVKDELSYFDTVGDLVEACEEIASTVKGACFEYNKEEYSFFTNKGADKAQIEYISSITEDLKDEEIPRLIEEHGVELILGEKSEAFFKEFWEEDFEYLFHEFKEESSSDDDLYIHRLHEELCDFSLMEPLQYYDEVVEYPNETSFDSPDEFSKAVENWESDEKSFLEKQKEEIKGKVDDMLEEYVSKRLEEIGEGEYAQEVVLQFGKEEFVKICESNNLLDFDEIAQKLIKIYPDSRGQYLNAYDGLEHEFADKVLIDESGEEKSVVYYMYQLNSYSSDLNLESYEFIRKGFLDKKDLEERLIEGKDEDSLSIALM